MLLKNVCWVSQSVDPDRLPHGGQSNASGVREELLLDRTHGGDTWGKFESESESAKASVPYEW